MVLLSPCIPLLFMGEEYGETAPFLYFISHSDPLLVDAVRRGRQEEFEAFGGTDETPDPNAETTFQRAKLNRGLLQEPKHRLLREFYRHLIHLAKRCLPSTSSPKRTWRFSGFEQEKVLFLRRWHQASQVVAIFNFGTRDSELRLQLEGGVWTKVLDSEDPTWKVKAAVLDSSAINLPRTILSNGTATVIVQSKGLGVFSLKQDL